MKRIILIVALIFKLWTISFAQAICFGPDGYSQSTVKVEKIRDKVFKTIPMQLGEIGAVPCVREIRSSIKSKEVEVSFDFNEEREKRTFKVYLLEERKGLFCRKNSFKEIKVMDKVRSDQKGVLRTSNFENIVLYFECLDFSNNSIAIQLVKQGK